jgi:hypothetical protein
MGINETDFINRFILWKPVKVVSVVAYVIIILLIPLSTFWATIMLFALICFWSRIPCLISDFTKDLEVVDFFTVMLAIHVGGLFAGIFGAAIMMFSRIFGPNEYFLYTVKDSICILIGGLLTPLFFSMTGSALYAIYLFTLFRYSFYLVLTLLIEPQLLALEFGECCIGITVAYVTNTYIMKFFEAPLTNLFETGLKFDINLFLFASGIIAFFYIASRFSRWLKQREKKETASSEQTNRASWYSDHPIRMIMLDTEAKELPLFVDTSNK